MFTVRIPLGRRFHFATMKCRRVLCRDRSFHTHHLLAIVGRSTTPAA